MREEVDLSAINRASAELSGQSDRAAALVGASLLEDQLESILRRYMIPHKNVDSLFESNGPLATFSAKIDMAHCLGLVSGHVCKELHIIRRIRNDCAHTHQPVAFSDPATRSRIESLPDLSFFLQGELQQTEEGRQLLKESRLSDPRRLWEMAIGFLYSCLESYLRNVKYGGTLKPTASTSPSR